MNPLRILIVDDEPLARDRLRGFLRAESGVEIIGECGNGTDAIAAIRGEKPDVVFLDVQMPGMDGLQVLANIPERERPVVIFATAHDKFAVDAFAVDAVDYLLKPFDRERLQAALRRAADHLQKQRAGDLTAKLESLLANASPAAGVSSAAPRKTERLALKAEGRVVFVRPDEIVWVEAADNYSVIHLASNERLVLRESLSSMEERLGATSFARVSRSAIVHLDQIKELQPTFHGDYVVLLRDGTKLPLSRSLRGKLDQFLGET